MPSLEASRGARSGGAGVVIATGVLLGTKVLVMHESRFARSVVTSPHACAQLSASSAAQQLKCYGRVMHVVTWNSEKPLPIMECDGILLGE